MSAGQCDDPAAHGDDLRRGMHRGLGVSVEEEGGLVGVVVHRAAMAEEVSARRSNSGRSSGAQAMAVMVPWMAA